MQEKSNFIILSVVGIVAIFAIIISITETSTRTNSIGLSEDVVGEASWSRRIIPTYPITSTDCLDVDGNHRVNTADVKLIEQVAMRRLLFTGNTCVADSNRDGLVNFQDVNDASRWSTYAFPITATPPIPRCPAPCNGPPMYLPSLECGDVDGNGILEYRDAWLIAVKSAWSLPVYGNTCAGDADGNGQVHVVYDSAYIASFIVGFIPRLHCPGSCTLPPPIATGECNDGVDNDGDTYTDYPADPECTSLQDDSELATPGAYRPECVDGLDNDADTFIDYPNDPGCGSYYDTDEAGQTQCDDQIDNDGDTFIDYPADPQCWHYIDNDESI